jgi:hypothetical protein
MKMMSFLSLYFRTKFDEFLMQAQMNVPAFYDHNFPFILSFVIKLPFKSLNEKSGIMAYFS